MTGDFRYIRAKSWEETATLLASYGEKAAILAGGTDLLPAMKLRIRKPEVIIDLKDIAESGAVREEVTDNRKTLALSALTRLSQICNSVIIRGKYPALVSAASRVGSPQLRNMGTLGGNICLNTRCIYYNQSEQWRKSRPACYKMNGKVCHVRKRGKDCLAEFQADTVPVLMALNADLKIISERGERIISVGDFYSGTGNPPNLLGSSELVKEIRLPYLPEGAWAFYEKFGVREGIDFAVVSVAVFLALEEGDRKCREARIVISGALPSPFLCKRASIVLQGQQVELECVREAAREAAREAKPINPTGFSVPYKRQLIEVLTARALQAIMRKMASG